MKIDLAKTESVDWTFETEDGSDEVVASISYTDDFEGWHPRAPKMKSPHPEYNDLKLKKLSAQRIEGHQIKVKLDYRSLNWEASYPGREESRQPTRRYQIEAPTSEEPLLTNRLFRSLSDELKRALQELQGSAKTAADYTAAETVIGSDTAGTLALSKIRKGYEAFLNPGIVWAERISTKNPADLELSKVGLIYATPPGGPPPIGSRTWLYIGVTAEQSEDGEWWEGERRWQASEPGGWDPDLYGEGDTEE